jgi:hypothetical protein
MSLIWKILPVWALLVLLTAAHSGPSRNTLLSCALTVAVLATAIQVTKASNWFLVWMTFALYFGIGSVNTLIEATLFQVLPPGVAFQSCALGLTTAFTISVLLSLLMGRMKIPDHRPVGVIQRGLVWKFAAGACVYFVLYCVAGIAVYPFVKDFYANRWLPSIGQLFGIQIVRGMFYMAMALPFLGRMTGRRICAAVTLGLCFSVLGGLAPLLLSNVYMPVPVRIAHSFEVGLSNFIYGVVVACLLVPQDATQTAPSELISALPNRS